MSQQRLHPVAREPACFQSPSNSAMRTPTDATKKSLGKYKGTRIGMSFITMPLFHNTPSHVDLMCPSKEEIDREENPAPWLVAKWLNAIPMYADLAGAHEIETVQPMFHDLLEERFEGLRLMKLKQNGKTPEITLRALGIPSSLITDGCRPDMVGLTEHKTGRFPVILGEFKNSTVSVQSAVAQAWAYMCAAALAFEHRSVDKDWKHVVIGGFVCNGFEIQFLRAFLIAPGFPSVSTVSHVIDLTATMGVKLAELHFRKLVSLVEYASGFNFEASDKGWLLNPPNTYGSPSVFIRSGALKRPIMSDVHASIRFHFLVLKHIEHLPYVTLPIGMVTGMRLEKDGPTTHMCYSKLTEMGFSVGLPSGDSGKAVLGAVGDAIAAVHKEGVVHGNLRPKHIFWKRDEKEQVLVKITGWDEAFFTDAFPAELGVKWSKMHLRKHKYFANSKGTPVEIDHWSLKLMYEILENQEGSDVEAAFRAAEAEEQ